MESANPSTAAGMEPLAGLLAKAQRLVQACAALRARNRQLEHEVVARDATINDLRQRMREQEDLRRKARERLERLASQLPGR